MGSRPMYDSLELLRTERRASGRRMLGGSLGWNWMTGCRAAAKRQEPGRRRVEHVPKDRRKGLAVRPRRGACTEQLNKILPKLTKAREVSGIRVNLQLVGLDLMQVNVGNSLCPSAFPAPRTSSDPFASSVRPAPSCPPTLLPLLPLQPRVHLLALLSDCPSCPDLCLRAPDLHSMGSVLKGKRL